MDVGVGVGVGVGSDIRGRMEEDAGGLGPALLVPVEVADCLAELGVPAPSLAAEVRLPEFAWSSPGWAAGCDF